MTHPCRFAFLSSFRTPAFSLQGTNWLRREETTTRTENRQTPPVGVHASFLVVGSGTGLSHLNTHKKIQPLFKRSLPWRRFKPKGLALVWVLRRKAMTVPMATCWTQWNRWGEGGGGKHIHHLTTPPPTPPLLHRPRPCNLLAFLSDRHRRPEMLVGLLRSFQSKFQPTFLFTCVLLCSSGFYTDRSSYVRMSITGIVERRTRDWKVAGSNPC